MYKIEYRKHNDVWKFYRKRFSNYDDALDTALRMSIKYIDIDVRVIEVK